ncbi:MAG: T9SS C-terminal target domain-containing protein [Bacteroidia bacterium]
MKKVVCLLLAGLLGLTVLRAQAPFDVVLQPVQIAQLGGLQSFAAGQANGKWLLIGGRLDGLHRRQPFASFDQAGHNNQLFVIDPENRQKWTAPLSSLPQAMQEQLRSTNMEFQQDGDLLYLIGGYGYSNSEGDHKTFHNLTVVDVPAVIDAIIRGTSFSSYFRQITDPRFAVTGGNLTKLYDTWYLSGGQRFDGRYNPMNGPSFTQTYTEAIRRFRISDNGTNITVQFLSEWNDAALLHRRDLNVVPQIMPNGEEGITMFSGVFQPTIDLPFLNAINIDSAGYAEQQGFSQYYNHYHSAILPLYSAAENEMHTVFFGGIAQYYDSAGVLVQDNDVPFVKTVARVTRSADGSMAEYKMPLEMSGYIGASAEFIPLNSIPTFPNEVIKLDELTGDTVLVGYIFGGINSSDKNIFWTNDGSQSSANSQLYAVYLVKDKSTGVHELNPQSAADLRMQLSPNPTDGQLIITLNMAYVSDVNLLMTDVSGKKIMDETIPAASFKPGKNYLDLSLPAIRAGSVLFVTVSTEKDKVVQKLIVK